MKNGMKKEKKKKKIVEDLKRKVHRDLVQGKGSFSPTYVSSRGSRISHNEIGLAGEKGS